MNNEPIRVNQSRWRSRPDGSRSMGLSIEWGGTPPAWMKQLKRSSLAVGKSLIEDRIQDIQAQLTGLREDVQAYFEMMGQEGR